MTRPSLIIGGQGVAVRAAHGDGIATPVFVDAIGRWLEVVHAMATHYAGGDSILAVYVD